MNIVHIQKGINTSPRKLRLVADLVRNMKPSQALVTLQFTPKAAALPLSKAIKTVLANAKMQNLDSETMTFKALEINEGLRMRRMRAGGRSKRKPYTRKMSQIKITLTNDVEMEGAK
jgi:large subunit ribosomal protein L22